MNERILELAEQAGYKPLSPPTFADELNEIFMQKFAELIVKECAGLVDHVIMEDGTRRSDFIRKHFRVEE